MQPQKISVSGDRVRLTLDWPDGRSVSLSAGDLRDNCQSARAKKLALSGLAVPAAPDLRIADISVIGQYGLNVTFSDGHDRGIYPWVFLRGLTPANRTVPTTDQRVAAKIVHCGN